MVSLSYLAHLVIRKSCTYTHLYSKFFFFLLFQELSLEEMANMPSCNLSKTVYNNLFATTYDNKIQAVMHMTNNRAYFKEKSSKANPSKQELKLKVAKCSGDPKKIVETLSQLLGVEGATT